MALAQPRFQQSGELHIAGLSRLYPRDQLAAIPDQWNKLASQLPYVQGRNSPDSYGVWYDVLSGGGKPMLYLTGVSIGAFAPVHSGFTRSTIAPQRYAVFAHGGELSAIRETIEAIFSQWLPTSGYSHYRQNDQAPDLIERYIEAAEGGKVGAVEIWLPVEKK